MALRPIYGVKRPVQSGRQQHVSSVVGGLVPAGPPVVPLGTAAAQSAATLALSAKTLVALNAATAVSTGALTVTWPGFVVGGKFVLRNARVVIAGVDLSTRSNAVHFEQSREEIDITSYADVNGYREYMPGEASSTFAIELFADPTTLTPALWTALQAGAVAVEVSSGPTYPTWLANAIMVNGTSLNGKAGDAATTTIELHSTGTVLEV